MNPNHKNPPSRLKNIVGEPFGRLTVESYAGGVKWLCVCKCGNRVTVKTGNLRSGNTQSCGCLQRDRVVESLTVHGLSKSKVFASWSSMIQRCTNPNNPAWKDYGGRGITVCERWMTFENFYADMGDLPFAGAQIERKDNNAGYSKDNCKWATRKEECNNRRSCHNITFRGRTQTARQWEEELGLPLKILHSRIKVLGWTETMALTTPVRRMLARDPIFPKL